MRIALVSTTALACAAALCAVASAHQENGPGASGGCPPPKPAAKAPAAKARPHCVVHRRLAARLRAGKHVYASRWVHRRGPDDFGTAPSQAFVYGREFERDHRPMSAQWYAQRSLGPTPGVAARPPARPMATGRPYAQQGPMPSAGAMPPQPGAMRPGYGQPGPGPNAYGPPRRPAPQGPDQRGYMADGDRSEGGYRYAWSWSSDGQAAGPPCGPCGARRDGGHWRLNQGGGYEVYRNAGRDDNGFLTWAGKPR
jgi:hypothetical protein